MKTEQADLFTSAPIPKAVLSLVVPTVISQLITVVYNMADTFFIGKLNDPAQVAAAAIAMPAFMFLTGIANLFGIGGSSLISRSLGAGERERAKHAASFCIWSGIAAAFAYGILLMVLRPVVLPVLGAKSETYGYVYQYSFWTITVGAVPTVMNSELAHLVRSEGYSRQASLGVAFGGVLNILLDPIFIFGFQMEIAGAALATMLSNAAAAVYFVILLYRKRKSTVILPDPRYFTFGDQVPGEVVTVGFPSFLMILMGIVSNTVLNSLLASHSEEAIAGMGIAKKIDMVAYAAAQGMTQGALPLIGYNFTSGSRKRMTEAVKITALYALSLAAVEMALLLSFAGPVTELFIDNAETVAYGRTFLKIIAVACPTTTMNCLIITVFQAAGKKIQPLVLSLLRKGGLDVPLMYWFCHLLGITGIAWATPLADAISLVIAAALFVPYFKRLYGKGPLSES